jgi:hypothetical protein
MIFADLYTQKQTLRWNTRAGSLVGNTITIAAAHHGGFELDDIYRGRGRRRRLLRGETKG